MSMPRSPAPHIGAATMIPIPACDQSSSPPADWSGDNQQAGAQSKRGRPLRGRPRLDLRRPTSGAAIGALVAKEQMQQPGQHGAADDGPHKRKRLAINVDHQERRQVEGLRDPPAQVRADKTDRNRRQAAAARETYDGLSNGPGYRGNQDQDNETQ